MGTKKNIYQTVEIKKMCSISEVIEDCDLNNDLN